MKFILANDKTIIRDSLITWIRRETNGTLIHFNDGSEKLFDSNIFTELVRQLPAETDSFSVSAKCIGKE